MGLIPKFLRKLQPLKILGKAVSATIPGAAPVVGAIDNAIKSAKGKGVKVDTSQVIQGAVTGAASSIQTQVSGAFGLPAGTTLEKYAVPGAILVVGGVITLVMLSRRR